MIAQYMGFIKAGLLIALLAGLGVWHFSAVSKAHKAGYAEAQAEYQAKYTKDMIDAQQSAEAVRVENARVRAALESSARDNALSLRKQLAAARNSGPAVQAGATSDQRTGDTGRTDNNAEARRTDQIDNAISDAVAEYRAALLSCGQSVGNVADKIK